MTRLWQTGTKNTVPHTSVQFKEVSVCLGKPICAPPHLSNISPELPYDGETVSWSGCGKFGNEGPLSREPRAIKGFHFQGWNGWECSFACFAYCQEICLSNFCLLNSFNFFSLQIFFKNKVARGFHSELDFTCTCVACWLVFHFDTTAMVDWAINIRISELVDLHMIFTRLSRCCCFYAAELANGRDVHEIPFCKLCKLA